MKDPSGNPPPAGGFQTGGWYSGYQYWKGTFASQAGQEHPASDSATAGQTVSEEVNTQGDVAQGLAPGTNQAFINQQNAQPQQQQQAPAPAPTPSTPSASSSRTAGSASGISAPEAEVDLTGMFKNLQESSGVTSLQDEYLEKERQFIEAKGKINDNPFLSEATRVGREAKITKLFNERTANIQNEIAMKKADIETQMNLQIKQIDMNSDAVQRNIDNLNNLISIGAFNNATGETIAQWTRLTGITSDLIMSAVNAGKEEDVETSIRYSVADSGEETVTVTNSKTGDVINQKSIGFIGNAQTGKADTVSDSEAKQLIKQDLKQEASRGATWDQIYSSGIGYISSVEELYQIYLSANYYKPTVDQKNSDLGRYGVTGKFE